MNSKLLNMNRIIIILVLVFGLATSMVAQKTILYVNNSADIDNAIELRIFTNDLKNQQGLDIYRKSNSTNWQKINQSPIKQKTLAEVGSNYDENTKKLIELLNSDENTSEGIIKLVLILNIIQNKDLADAMGLRYIDKTIQAGESYYYKITAANSTNEMVVSENFTADKYSPTSPPDSMNTYQENNKSIVFKWLPNTDRFYAVNIYKSINDGEKIKFNSDPILISKIVNEKGIKDYPEIKYTDEEVTLGNNYKYQIEALDYFGNKGALSTVMEVNFKDIIPPPKANKIFPKVNDKTQSVILSWKIKGATDLLGFNIYLRPLDDSIATKINTTLIAADTNKYSFNVQSAGKYKVAVEAIDSAGNKSISDERDIVILDLSAPAKPENVSFAFGDKGKIIFSWDGVKTEDFMTYRIYRKESKAKHYTLMNAHNIDTAFFEDKISLTVKNSFSYYIVTLDTSFNTSEKSDLIIVKLPDITAPSKPFIKQAIITNNSITIKWIANRDIDLAGYNLYLISDKDTNKLNDELIVGNSFIDNNKYGYQTLNYVITAIDSSNNESIFSNTYSLNSKKVKQADGTFTRVKLKYKGSIKEFTLSWKYDGKIKPIGFIVYRAKNDSKMKPITGMTSETTFKDKNPAEGTYKYKITAFYSNGEKITSEIKQITIKP